MTGAIPLTGRPIVLVAVLVALLAAACSAPETPPRTARVDRGAVTTAVSASGSLAAASERNLGFSAAGQLTEVLVRVGDRVEPGQVLARLDDVTLRQTLDQRRADLAQQQALLGKQNGSNAVSAAADTLQQSKKGLDATEEQVDATAEANRSATDRAQDQLDLDRSTLRDARTTLRNDENACRAASAVAAPAAGTAATGTAGTTTTTTTDPSCNRVASDRSAVTQAENTVVSSEAAVAAAKQTEKTGAAAGQVSVENARQSVVDAQNDLDSASSDRPADTDSQSALVSKAQAAVRAAQRDVDNAVLRAPLGGVVAAVNGAVGEFVSTPSRTTGFAPGGDAPLPELPDLSSTAGASVPGDGAFVVLAGVQTFQVVVPFEESDAARVQAGQSVQVSVDAVPDRTLPGTVLELSPVGTTIDGVVTFYATVGLSDGEPRLRAGQTAVAAVLVDSVDSVLRVPSTAVRTENGSAVVDVEGADGQAVPTPFRAGRTGDDFTEVLGGLSEGQEVRLPTAQVSATEDRRGPRNRGGGR